MRKVTKRNRRLAVESLEERRLLAGLVIESTVSQSGVDCAAQTGCQITSPSNPYDFAGQDFGNLKSITGIEITASIQDADSFLGDFDFNQLVLHLDGISTGIFLNGFGLAGDPPHEDFTVVTHTVIGTPANASALLDALKIDGKLNATFISIAGARNGVAIPSGQNTTLKITGDADATDLIAKSLTIDNGIVNFSYEIAGSALPVATTVNLFWSDDASFDSGDSPALTSPITITAGTAVGTYNESVSRSDVFRNRNGNATLLLVVDPQDSIAESDETNNVVSDHPATTYVFIHGGFQLSPRGVAEGLNDLKDRLERDLGDEVIVSNVSEFRWGLQFTAPDLQLAVARHRLISFLTQHDYSQNDQVVLIGHSYGGHLVYSLADQGLADALVTIDPVDWNECGISFVRPPSWVMPSGNCDQSDSGDRKDSLDIPTWNAVQRQSIIRGYDIEGVLPYRSIMSHTDIDGEFGVHSGIVSFLRTQPIQASNDTTYVSLENPMAAAAFQPLTSQLALDSLAFLDNKASTVFDVRAIDLPPGRLAEIAHGVITFDVDANGVGWFIDPTPNDPSEFTQLPDGSFVASPDSPAFGRYDLATVVLHELGHLQGHDHTSDGLMAATLPLGTRRLPDEGMVDFSPDPHDEELPLVSFIGPIVLLVGQPDLPTDQQKPTEIDAIHAGLPLLPVPNLAEPTRYEILYGERIRIEADEHDKLFGDLDADWLLFDPEDWLNQT